MAFTVGFPAPGSLTANIDTVLTLAFANSGRTIFDAISKNNAFFYEIKQLGMYEGVEDPEPFIEVPLMYALGTAEWFEGWDTLNTQPTDNLTAVFYPWRELATPAGYNRRESRIINPNRLKEMAKLKIQTAQMTMQETFNLALLLGNGVNGGNLYDPQTSPTTGRQGIEPLARLIYYDGTLVGVRQPSGTLVVGGLDQATYSWWRNWSLNSAATTYNGLLLEFDEMYENCSKGPGGPPTLILTDIKTRILLNNAYYQAYRRHMESDNSYPFDNLKFRGAHVVVDESMPDVATPATNTDTKGTAYFINPKFLKVKYDSQANFILTDLQKPVNQQGKVGHCIWMGNTCMMNRRKHGVIGDIARTLTV